MYNRLSPSDIEALRTLMPGRVFAGPEISEDYGHDEMGGIHRMPDLLVRARSTEEVAAVMALASAKRVPVVTRGSGTGLVGGAVAVRRGILVDTTLMNRILELDEDNLTVTAQAGVLLMDLAEHVQKREFFYPPDPGEKAATIGGNIATNAGGMRAVKYGVTRDYVLGLTVVLPSGEIVALGGKTAKNSSGYSLLNLIVGSEGTLGIITEAILRLLPLPRHSMSLLVPFGGMEAALGLVPEILKAKIIPTAIEYMSRETILYAEEYLGKKFPDTKSSDYLLMTFDGSAKEGVRAELYETAKFCLDHGALDAYIVDTDERMKSVWTARGAFLEAIKASTTEMDECDVVVPKAQIAAFLRYIQDLAGEYGVRIPCFGHAGDGNVHVYICRDGLSETQWRQALGQLFDRMYLKAGELGGQVSGEHGIGWSKRAYLQSRCGEAQMRLMRGVKAAFDPQGILNPDKIIISPAAKQK